MGGGGDSDLFVESMEILVENSHYCLLPQIFPDSLYGQTLTGSVNLESLLLCGGHTHLGSYAPSVRCSTFTNKSWTMSPFTLQHSRWGRCRESNWKSGTLSFHVKKFSWRCSHFGGWASPWRSGQSHNYRVSWKRGKLCSKTCFQVCLLHCSLWCSKAQCNDEDLSDMVDVSSLMKTITFYSQVTSLMMT